MRTIVQIGFEKGALDLGLSLAYAALLLVLIGVSYLSITRRARRK